MFKNLLLTLTLLFAAPTYAMDALNISAPVKQSYDCHTVKIPKPWMDAACFSNKDGSFLYCISNDDMIVHLRVSPLTLYSFVTIRYNCENNCTEEFQGYMHYFLYMEDKECVLTLRAPIIK